MNKKLVSLVLVAVLLGASVGGIIAVTQTEVVEGATGPSTQATPHFAGPNPAFIKYEQDVAAGNVSTGTSAHGGLGIIPSPVNLSQLKGQTLRNSLVGYVPTYDLRTQNKVTSVKDQGSCASCWAFGAYASLESYLLTGETRDFSENNMKNTHGFDPAPCAGGNQFFATAYLARWSGPVNEVDDQYSASGGTSPASLPIQKHVQEVYFIPDRAGSTDNDNIKMAVSTYGAVYTQMYIDATSPYYNDASYAYYYGSTTSVNHGVAIVGWDDSYSRTKFLSGNQPPGDGAFIVKNSWGTSWGEQGYFYVSYYDAVIGRDNAVFTAQPTTNYNNIYQYDPLGDTGAFGLGSSTWGANIFTANASENLTAVSFYTLSLNAPYEVYIYTDPANGPINASGYAAHTTGTIALPGYHTISLNPGVSLHAGQKFSVVVKFTSTDTTPVPTENPIAGYSSAASAKAGESYYHADNTTWQMSSTWDDMTSYSLNTNICIKAFTKDATPVDASIASAPAVCAQDANSLDIFVQGTDNALWYKHYQAGSGWSAWQSLGGVLSATPAAVSQSSGKINVAVRGSDGALWSRNTTNGGSSWSGWSKIGGQLASGTGPAAYAWGDTRIGWMVTGTDNQLWHIWKDSSGTHSWQSLGGVLTSSPATTSSASGAIDVFVRGSDGALWQRGYSNNAWGGWGYVGGQLASGTGPAASSWGAGRLDVFVQGTDNVLWHKSYNGAWSGWESLGGKLTSSPAAAAASGSSRIDVSVRGSDGALWWKSYSGGWGGWTPISGMVTATIYYVPQAGSTWANQGIAGASYDAYVSTPSLFQTASNGYPYWGEIGKNDYIYIPAGSATNNQNVASWEIGFHFTGIVAGERYQKIWDKAYGGFSVYIDTFYGADSSYLTIYRATTGGNGSRWYIPHDTALRAGHNYYVQIAWDTSAGPGKEPYPTVWIGEDGNAPVHQANWDETGGALGGTGSWYNDAVGGVNLGNTGSNAGSNTSAKTAWLNGGFFVYRQYDSIIDFSSGGSWQADKIRLA